MKAKQSTRVSTAIAALFAFFILVDQQDTGGGTTICIYESAGGEVIHITIPEHEFCKQKIKAR